MTATVTGAGEVIGLVIDPTAIDPPTPRASPTWCWPPFRDANRAAAELQQQAMGPLAQGLGGLGGLSLPGL